MSDHTIDLIFTEAAELLAVASVLVVGLMMWARILFGKKRK